jgi:hypothetical protein
MSLAPDRYREFIAIAIVVIFLGGMSYVLSFGRCLHCHRALGRLLYAVGFEYKIPAELRFCPYCGKSLDEPEQT